MLDWFRFWKDSVGAKFSDACNRVSTAFNNGVQDVNKELQNANNVIARRVPVQSHSKEISDLIVR